MGELEKLRKREYTKYYKVKLYEMDKEKRMHSPELYAVWNLKTYIATLVSRFNPFRSQFFIYTDTGAWREREFTNWPDDEFVRKVADLLDNRVLYGQIRNPTVKNFSPYIDFIEGKLTKFCCERKRG